jgi:hypothetical protein
VESVAWSADGRLASGSSDQTIIIWDLASGQPAQTLKGHTHWINSVAWSADGRLASGSSDNTVIIWDLVSGQPTQILKGHTDSVESVAWSADGHLASGSWDETVIVVENQLTYSACHWVFRNLTVDEWLNTQGLLYVYRPICSNLPAQVIPVPTMFEWILLFFLWFLSLKDILHFPGAQFLWLTWPGRLVVLVVGSFYILLALQCLHLVFKGAVGIFRFAKARFFEKNLWKRKRKNL